MNKLIVRQNNQAESHGSMGSYIIGFILSLVLTIIPFLLVTNKLLEGTVLIGVLFLFALMQLLVQLIFFLHLGRGSDKKWNVTVFLFMLLVVVIVVIGSLWIMSNLHYSMMSPLEKDAYMRTQGLKGF